MFKHLIKIFILGMGLCCLTPAFATMCATSAKFTQGVGGPTVTNLNLTTSTGTINNLVLEINFDQFGAIPVPATTPLAGDFCSLTYGQPGAQFRNGTFSSGTNYWTITYGVPTKSISNSSVCASTAYNYITTIPHPFSFHWLENVTGGNTAKTKAEAFYYTSGSNYSYLCNNTKFHIPLSIQYAIGPSNALGFTVTVLYNIVGGCCGNGDFNLSTYTKTGTDLIIRKMTGSCSVTAPSLDLGTFKPTVARTNGILGGVLKSTTVTLNCPNVYQAGVSITPKVTISDAGNAGNTSCNPINTAANGSNAFVALFRSAAIDDTAAGRYCVSTVNYNNSIINTMTFPQITSSAYTASMPIYAALRYNDTASNPSVGAVTSTLTLTVTYD